MKISFQVPSYSEIPLADCKFITIRFNREIFIFKVVNLINNLFLRFAAIFDQKPHSSKNLDDMHCVINRIQAIPFIHDVQHVSPIKINGIGNRMFFIPFQLLLNKTWIQIIRMKIIIKRSLLLV